MAEPDPERRMPQDAPRIVDELEEQAADDATAGDVTAGEVPAESDVPDRNDAVPGAEEPPD